MIAEQLRKSVLQAAIQGKLTEQLPEDGDARDLLKEIQKEKERLMKEGKIKKEKALPEITEDEITFDIPENWCWAKLNDCLDVRDGTHDTPKYVAQGIPLITSKNLNDGALDFSTARLISVQDSIDINNRSRVDDGDILFAMIGSIGNPVLVKKEKEFSIKNVALFKNVSQIMDMQYVYFYLKLEQDAMKRKSSGGVQAFVSLKFLRNYLIPLPPFAEQQRIAERLNEILPEIVKLEKDEQKLNELQRQFPKKIKNSILQYATQGKLTEQLESDGDARDLLKEIKKEKTHLIKEGKIKKEKTLPEITEDEIPFDIPANWCWVRLGEICTKITDGTHNPPPDSGSGIQIISATNLKNGKIDLSQSSRFITRSQFIKEDQRTSIREGDVLLSIVGTIGETAVVNEKIELSAQRSVCVLRTLIYNKYLSLVFKSPMFTAFANEKSAGTAQKGIYLGTVSTFTVPLPPLAEQHRIVERLDQLLPLCDELE